MRPRALIAAVVMNIASGCASNASPSSPAPASASSAEADAAVEQAPAPDPTHWRSVAPLATARSAHTATLLADGRVLVVGGQDDAQRMFATTEIFDPTSETWHAGPALPSPRANHVAIALNDGRVLIAGGGKSTPTGQPRGERVTNDALFFDPKTDSFAPAPPMLEARSHFEALRLPSGAVLVVGGGSDRQGSPEDCKNAPYCGPYGIALASAEIFDPAANRFRSVGAMATPRSSFAIAPLADGRVVAIGGVNENAIGYRSTEFFDPNAETWSAGPDLAGSLREHHRAITTGSGTVFVAGGKNPNVTPLATTERLDANGTAWRAGPTLGEPRTSPGLAQLASGRVLVAGGFAQLVQLRGGDGSVREAFVFDDAENRLTPIAPLAEGRVLHTTTVLADGRVLVTGGSGTKGSLASCEIAEP